MKALRKYFKFIKLLSAGKKLLATVATEIAGCKFHKKMKKQLQSSEM